MKTRIDIINDDIKNWDSWELSNIGKTELEKLIEKYKNT
jgi:hypothetical protein